ncbi:MAG: 3-deoxy-8-phosphooctulonate synthase [Bacteroidales bacterium]|nr:3-deoxy-8-phosphooctulonate synthase [Bacteroidales bacterium]MDZ4205568.1 3-deoxy-8-phosphooctulonate synthase [Bacteroidales bacterium]
MRQLKSLPGISHINSGNFFLIAGPCVVENLTMPLEIAITLKNICHRLEIPFIFKASYKKANRTSESSFKGIGDIEALDVIGRVSTLLNVPTLTDIHSEAEADLAARYADVLQIPAFLCRQTELLQAAARTGKMINIKKGQSVSAQSMAYAAEKVKNQGNPNIMLTERGSMFGYSDLVLDLRNIFIMKKFGYPVVLDVTHTLQQPNQPAGVTGGLPEMIETIACAGIAAGVDGIFIETHPNPAKALSDGANMLELSKLENLLLKLLKIRKAVQE